MASVSGKACRRLGAPKNWRMWKHSFLMGVKMADLKIHKFTYPPPAIFAMNDDRRSAFLLLGLFLKEVNWLQKLLIMGMPDVR